MALLLVFLGMAVMTGPIRASAVASAGTAPRPTPSPEQQIREIAERWVGDFDNHLQVRSNLERGGARGPELSVERREMKVVRLEAPQLGKDILFFEEYRAATPGKAHRQRVVSLEWDEKRGQVRVRQFFFRGARYDRDPLDPARVAKMTRDEFNLARPFCDLWFTWRDVRPLPRCNAATDLCLRARDRWHGHGRVRDAAVRLRALVSRSEHQG